MSDPLPQVGSRLKAERERQGSSLQKAATALHLDPWVVGALEADEYVKVGPPVFVKGHLKRYAELVGLAPQDIVSSYESLVQTPAARPAAPSAPQAGVPPVARLTWPPLAALALLVIVGVAALWLKPWRARDAHPTGAPTAANRLEAASGASTPPGSGPVPAETDPARSAAAPSPGAERAVAHPASPPVADTPQGAGHARLRLSFSADSWVDIHDAAGRRVYAGHGRANSVRTLSGDAPMHVYLRYASGVQLEINNRAVAIGRQFMAGDMARFEAGADGVLRREATAAAAPVAQARDTRPTG